MELNFSDVDRGDKGFLNSRETRSSCWRLPSFGSVFVDCSGGHIEDIASFVRLTVVLHAKLSGHLPKWDLILDIILLYKTFRRSKY